MKELYFYNTLTRKKERFEPIDPENIRVYVCGPTVYDYAHIGNARPVVVFDMLYRLLRAVYGENHVLYVRNITDIDDKINARAARDYPDMPLNDAIRRLTEQTEKQFHADIAALNCLLPDKEPRATENIEKMKALIEQLLGKGFAYIAENHILFSVPAMNKAASAAGQFGNPPYGRLSRRSSNELLAGARINVESYKRDPQDFVLWKPSAAGEPGWLSPGGIKVLGRPGWHIECSAMSMAELLEPYKGGLLCDNPQKNCFDIHGGGLDLIFPHHENEIAQSCCAFNGQRMANFWLHNGFVQVEGQKMSKSLGNFTTIRQVLESDLLEFTAETPPELKIKWAGLTMRFAMLQTHYRKPLDWTKDRLEASSAELYRWYLLLRKHGILRDKVPQPGFDNTRFEIISDVFGLMKNKLDRTNPLLVGDISYEERIREIREALSDDLNTPQMMALLRHYYKTQQAEELVLGMELLGLASPELQEFIKANCSIFTPHQSLNEEEIERQVQKRAKAIAVKNWAEADKIRDALLAKGIKLQDSVDNQTGKRVVKWERV